MARVLKRAPGFSLAELILSLGLTVVAVMSAIALAISALRGTTKSADLLIANSLAVATTDTFVYGLPGVNDPFWSAAQTGIYQAANQTVGASTFEEDLFLQDLSSSQPGLKMVTVNVSWGSGAQGQTGYGQQCVQVARLIYGH